MRRSAPAIAVAILLAAAPVTATIESPLGLDAHGQCVGDSDGDALVQINEIILAVNNTLGGCPLRPVELRFKGVVGDHDFACGEVYEGVGTGPGQFIPADFRFYVSDVHLVTPAGEAVEVTLEQDGIWQHEGVALIDLEDGSGPCANGNEATNAVVRGTVPAGVYTGIRYTLGIPFELNHGNASTAPSPLNFTSMFWSWQGGYKFIRVDTADDKFRIHVGSTGCDSTSPSRPPDSCSRPNRATVSLSGFDPDRSVILADLAALLADSDVDANAEGTPPGCMAGPDDDDCAPLFANLGLTFPGGMPDHHQHFFRVQAPSTAPHAPHSIFDVGASEDGGGQLVALPDFSNPWALPFSACLGGGGDDCAGGVRLYTDSNPGFSPLDADDPDHPAYVIDDGVTVTAEIVAIAEGLSIKIEDAIYDTAGQRFPIGTSPELHLHPEYLLAVPAGMEPHAGYDLTYRLTAPGHDASAEFTVTFTPTGGDGHGHEHDDEHDGHS